MAKYEVIKDFGDLLKVKNSREQWGYVTKEGDVIIKPSYDYLGDLQKDGFVTTKKIRLWGLLQIQISPNSVREICNRKYLYVSSFRNGFATVLKETGYNFITADGEEMFEQDFTEIVQKLPNGFVVVKKDGLFGVVNVLTATETLPCTYTSISTCGTKVKVQKEVVLA